MDSKDKTNKREGEILDKISGQDKVLCKIREIVTKSSDGKYIYRGQSSVYYAESDANHPQMTSTLYRAMNDAMNDVMNDAVKDEVNRAVKDAMKDVTSDVMDDVMKNAVNNAVNNAINNVIKNVVKEHGGGFEGADWLDMNRVQKEAMKAAQDFTDEKYDNKEMLSRIQHYSGDTNLLDFTKDYLVALFFACYRKHDKDGKVFLLEISGLAISELEDSEEDSEIKIINPVHPPNRVIAQKSVFVQSRSGMIRDDESRIKVIEIPCELKQHVLEYLEEHHDISLTTIYNDLHGYIWNRKAHGNAIMEFYLGLNYGYKSDNIQPSEKKVEVLQKAIKHFSNAIQMDPNFVPAHYNRGFAWQNYGEANLKLNKVSDAKSNYKDAIKDYDKAIELAPKYVNAYNNRGLAKACCGGAKRKLGDEPGAIIDYKDAIKDYDKAIERDSEYVNAYFNRGLAKEELGGRDNLQQALSDFEKAEELALQQKKESTVGKAQKGIGRVKATIDEMPEE